MTGAWEALPPFSDEYALTVDQIESYWRDGHILLREVAPKEATKLFRPYIIVPMKLVVKGRDRQDGEQAMWA